MKENAMCGVCGQVQGNGPQKIIPIVQVDTGTAIYRCSEHLNVPARDGEGETYHA